MEIVSKEKKSNTLSLLISTIGKLKKNDLCKL